MNTNPDTHSGYMSQTGAGADGDGLYHGCIRPRSPNRHVQVNDWVNGDEEFTKLGVSSKTRSVTTASKRVRRFSEPIGDPTNFSTQTNTQKQQRKRSHSEKTGSHSNSHRSKSGQESNAPYIDQILVPGQKLLDMLALKPPLINSIAPQTVSEGSITISSSPGSGKVTAIFHTPIVIDEQGDDFNLDLRSDDFSISLVEDQEVVISAKRISKPTTSNRVIKSDTNNGNGPVRNSLDVRTITSHDNDELEQAVAEEVEQASNRSDTWDFAESYYKRARRLSTFKPPFTSLKSLDEPAQMSAKPRRPIGGVVPRNTLGRDVSNNQNTPFVQVGPSATDSKGFDLHQKAQHATSRNNYPPPNKKRRTDDGALDAWKTPPLEAEHSRKSVDRSQSASNRQPSQRDANGVAEFQRSESYVRSESRPRLRNTGLSNNLGGSTTRPINHRSKFMKHGDVMNPQEIPDDPIYDGEVQSPTAASNRASQVSVVISVPLGVTSGKKIALANPNQAGKGRSAGHPVDTGDHQSRYFQNTSHDTSTPFSSTRLRSGRDSKHIERPFGLSLTENRKASIRGTDPKDLHDDENDTDELARSPLGPHDRRDQHTANSLVGKYLVGKSKELKQSGKDVSKDSSRHASIVLDDGSDDEFHSVKTDIKPTYFTKVTKTKRAAEGSFDVLQIYSSQDKWLALEDNSNWAMMLDSQNNTLSIRDSKGVPHEDLQLNPQSILKILRCDDCSRLIVHKSSDQTARSANTLHLELGTGQQAAEFASAVKERYRVDLIDKDEHHINKVFSKALGTTQRLKKVETGAPAPDEEVMLLEKKSEMRNRKHQAEIQESKRTSGGRRVRDSMTSLEEISPKNETGVLNTRNKAKQPHDAENTPKNHSGNPRRLVAGTELSRKAKTAAVEPAEAPITRSSSRLVDRDRRPPSLEENFGISLPQWSKENKDWAKLWNKSVVYPQKGIKKTTVDEVDIPRLDEGEYLNDNLILFYIYFLEQRLSEQSPNTAERVLFMNSFFYARLTSGVSGKAGINYGAVERWTTKFNIFDYDYIVIPVNESQHWYLAIICNAPKLIKPSEDVEGELSETQTQEILGSNVNQEYPMERGVDAKLEKMSLDNNIQSSKSSPDLRSKSDTTFVPVDLTRSDDVEVKSDLINPTTNLTPPVPTSQNKKGKGKQPPLRKVDTLKPRIMTLDSLGASHSGTCTKLKKWLMCEAETKLARDLSELGPLGITARNIPQQPNYCDCGIYLLMYLEEFLYDPDAFILGILSEQFKEKSMLLPDASEKRNEIRELLFFLQKKPSADIKDLEQVTSKFNRPKIEKIEKKLHQVVIPDSSHLQASKSARNSSDRTADLRLDNAKQAKEAELHKPAVIENPVDIHNSPDIFEIENSNARGKMRSQQRSSKIANFLSFFSGVKNPAQGDGDLVVAQTDIAEGILTDKHDTPKTDMPPQERDASTRFHSYTRPRERELVSPSPMPDASSMSNLANNQREEYHRLDREPRHPVLASDSTIDSPSSTANTVENAEEVAPPVLRPKSQRKSLEIRDSQGNSQDNEDEMLLPSKETDHDGELGEVNYLTDSDAEKDGPNLFGNPDLGKSEVKSAPQLSPERALRDKSATISPRALRSNRGEQHEKHDFRDVEEIPFLPSQKNKRKRKLGRDEQQETEQSPAVRRRVSSPPQTRDASDQAIIGNHTMTRPNRRRDESASQRKVIGPNGIER